jgi:hypothetical protein
MVQEQCKEIHVRTICHLPFAICHLPFAICHLPFAICYFLPAIFRVAFISLEYVGTPLLDLRYRYRLIDDVVSSLAICVLWCFGEPS